MIKHFVFDVDGVLTDGRSLYTADGKVMKAFGPHDSDGLRMLKPHLDIQFISSDRHGFEISYTRVFRHLGFPLTLVRQEERYDFVKSLGFDQTAFMGDSYMDAAILRDCAFGFVPKSARPEARAAADIITDHAGGDGAVMDACLFMLENPQYWQK